MINLILIFLYFSQIINSLVFIEKFLTIKQWTIINKLLINPNITIDIRNKLHYILFKYYDQWAFTKAYKFKQLHKYKCKHISTLELYNYAAFGLYLSIKNYKANINYKNTFIPYAEKIIYYELLKSITDLHPITTVSKNERRQGYNTNNKKNKSKLSLIGKNDWIYDINNNENIPKENQLVLDNYLLMWNKINKLNYFQQKIMKLKFDFYFNIKMSYKKISLLIGCSEEWIRYNIKLIIKNLI